MTDEPAWTGQEERKEGVTMENTPDTLWVKVYDGQRPEDNRNGTTAA